MSTTAHHRVVIVGGGSAGITVAARLARLLEVDDIAVIEPSEHHYYQPLWTLVGGGRAKVGASRRTQRKVMPKGVHWIRDAAAGFVPDEHVVETASGARIGYDALVVAPGIQLDWEEVDGLSATLGTGGVSSNYTYELAPKTWDFIRSTTSGTAVFTMPAGPIKCAGAPQKIAYLAADYWREQGVLDQIDVHLVLPTPGMFGLKVFADALADVAAGYGITVHFEADLRSVDPDGRTATFASMREGGEGFSLPYDMMHVTPHQSAPDWIKSSPLANDTPFGYVDVDKHTLQHVRYPNIFSLGDAGSTPNSKTGAAVRKQAPVVAANVAAFLASRGAAAGVPVKLPKSYDGYASCPLTTSRHHLLLAEFDYQLDHTPIIPVIDWTKPQRDENLFKKVMLPAIYWNGMLKGRL